MAGDLYASVVGNVGQDPEIRQAGGTSVLNLRVCANVRAKKDGQWTDVPQWIGVTCFGKRAEALVKIVSKGTQVMARGRLELREYDDKNGVRRTSVSVIADEVQLLGGKRDGSRAESARAPAYDEGDVSGGGGGYADDDIPFDAYEAP